MTASATPPSRTAAWRRRGGFGPATSPPRLSDIFEDIFGDLMGGGAARRRRGGRERGADLRYNMEITLEEAFAGKTATIRVPTSVSCEACTGTGAKPGTQPADLPDLRRPRHGARAAGLLHDRAHLPDLPAAAARSIDDPCPDCARRRAACTEERTLSVNIPAGVEDGTRIRLASEGEAGLRGGAGGRSLHLPRRSSRTSSSSATAPTSTAGCRSR